MKVCTAHDTHCSEVHGAEALLGIFFVSNFSTFLSEALLGLFSKHFFPHFSLWLECEKLKTVEIHRNEEDGSTEKKNLQNPHPWVCIVPSQSQQRVSGFFSIYFFQSQQVAAGRIKKKQRTRKSRRERMRRMTRKNTDKDMQELCRLSVDLVGLLVIQ